MEHECTEKGYEFCSECQYDIGHMYWCSDDGDDYKKAIYWYKKAADQGHSDAQYSLGKAYNYYPCGMSRDTELPEKAIYWYRKAAEQGHSDAQYELGRECSGEKAVYWFTKAAEQEHRRARYDLGFMYDRGWYRDREKAIYWYTKAAELGYESAQKRLDEFERGY